MKQPSVTRNISLTGKYCVLTKNDCRISVSSKIEKKKGIELRTLLEPYRSDMYGYIIRTNAKDCANDELVHELERLRGEYERLIQIAPQRVCYSCLKEAMPSYILDLRNIYQDGLEEILVEDQKLYEQISDYLKVCYSCLKEAMPSYILDLRNIYQDGLEEILVEDQKLYEQISDYLKEEQPEDIQKLRFYKDSLLPLHKLYGIETHISNALKEKVWMKSGAYLVIQPTEALTVIDVNTGKCIGKKKDDKVHFQINMEAAKEAAKQIRLRNMSGIILIDFVNLENKEKMNELLEYFRSILRQDPIQTVLVDMTKLQLIEVTRKKVRKPLYEALE